MFWNTIYDYYISIVLISVCHGVVVNDKECVVVSN